MEETQKKISIDIDDKTTPTIDPVFAYETDEKRYLSILNRIENAIQIYDIDESGLFIKIQFDREGDKGLGNVNGYYIKSLDSIYVTATRKILYISNLKGEIIDMIQYGTDTIVKIRDNFCSNQRTPLIITDNCYFITQGILGHWPKMSAKGLLSQKISVEIGKNEKVKYLPMTFPVDYYSKGKTLIPKLSRIKVKNKFIYSFFYDHNLYYTEDHKKINKVYMKSKYSNEEFENLSDPSNSASMNANQRYYIRNSRYTKLLYDQYRDVIYRFVYPGFKMSKNDNIQVMHRFPKSFAIMILDSDLNLLGEKLFPENTYMETCFVLKEGLYISTGHVNNKNYNENKIEFQLFKLTKNEH